MTRTVVALDDFSVALYVLAVNSVSSVPFVSFSLSTRWFRVLYCIVEASAMGIEERASLYYLFI